MENIHQQYPELFSPILKVRYEVTKALQEALSNYRPDVWEACWGSANGWTMLVGPSPGTRKDGEEGLIDPNKPRPQAKNSFWIGTDAGGIWFSDEVGTSSRERNKTSREAHWTRLTTAASKGDRHMADALTTVANLDFLNCALEKDIRKQRLNDGCKVVFEVMQRSRPRLVIPLTTLVYQYLTNFLSPYKVIRGSGEYFPDARFPLFWFRIPGCDWDSVMIKTPKHPSRIPSNEALRGFTTMITEVLPD